MAKYQTTRKSVRPFSLKDFSWAAGFIEGEGTFAFVSKNNSPQVKVSQVQRQPLGWLEEMFGGNICPVDRDPQTAVRKAYTWNLCGPPAIGLMMTLYAFMTVRRRGQIDVVLEQWRKLPVPARYRARCANGHLLFGDNLYVDSRNKRTCRICKREKEKRYWHIAAEARRLRVANQKAASC